MHQHKWAFSSEQACVGMNAKVDRRMTKTELVYGVVETRSYPLHIWFSFESWADISSHSPGEEESTAEVRNESNALLDNWQKCDIQTILLFQVLSRIVGKRAQTWQLVNEVAGKGSVWVFSDIKNEPWNHRVWKSKVKQLSFWEMKSVINSQLMFQWTLILNLNSKFQKKRWRLSASSSLKATAHDMHFYAIVTHKKCSATDWHGDHVMVLSWY